MSLSWGSEEENCRWNAREGREEERVVSITKERRRREKCMSELAGARCD